MYTRIVKWLSVDERFVGVMVANIVAWSFSTGVCIASGKMLPAILFGIGALISGVCIFQFAREERQAREVVEEKAEEAFAGWQSTLTLLKTVTASHHHIAEANRAHIVH